MILSHSSSQKNVNYFLPGLFFIKNLGIREKNISLSEPIGKIMGKNTVVEKPPLEQHYDQAMSKVSEWEKWRKAGSQIGPWILLFIGAFITTAGFFYGIFWGMFTLGIIVGLMGILIIISAWLWSKKRSKGEKTIDDKIVNFKNELSRIEKEG